VREQLTHEQSGVKGNTQNSVLVPPHTHTHTHTHTRYFKYTTRVQKPELKILKLGQPNRCNLIAWLYTDVSAS